MGNTHYLIGFTLCLIIISYHSINANKLPGKTKSNKYLKARNFNKVFEQYMKESQIYISNSNETLLENYFDTDEEEAVRNCPKESIAFEFVYE